MQLSVCVFRPAADADCCSSSSGSPAGIRRLRLPPCCCCCTCGLSHSARLRLQHVEDWTHLIHPSPHLPLYTHSHTTKTWSTLNRAALDLSWPSETSPGRDTTQFHLNCNRNCFSALHRSFISSSIQQDGITAVGHLSPFGRNNCITDLHSMKSTLSS